MNYVIVENALPSNLFLEVASIASSGPFDNGKNTAQGLAKAVKQNLQLSPTVHGELLDRVGQAIKSHPITRSFALPCRIGRPILNRYEVGMEYGMHSDGAYVEDVRTDVSFTLFLDDPISYDGGELIIASSAQQFTFKLPAGCMLLYPTGALHRVAPVTRGTRHALIGWLQSRVRDPAQREIIAKLNHIPNTLRQDEKYEALATLAGECTQNLIRMWGE